MKIIAFLQLEHIQLKRRWRVRNWLNAFNMLLLFVLVTKLNYVGNVIIINPNWHLYNPTFFSLRKHSFIREENWIWHDFPFLKTVSLGYDPLLYLPRNFLLLGAIPSFFSISKQIIFLQRFSFMCTFSDSY